MGHVNLGTKLVLIQHFVLDIIVSSNINSEAHILGPSLSALLCFLDSLHVHPKALPMKERSFNFALKEPLFLCKRKNNLFVGSGPVLNRCHREGREGYDCASSAWTFSEGDCNLTRPEQDGDDIDKDEPLEM